MKSTTTIFLLALVFLNTGYVQPGQLSADKNGFHNTLANAMPGFSINQAKDYAAELIPLIENASGKRFISIPEIRIVNAEELNDILIRDLIPKIKIKKKNWGKERILNTAKFQAKYIAAGQLGMYSPKDKTLYLSPKRIAPLLELLNLDKCQSETITKLHITHELTHALQDQYMDLEKKILEIINSPDALEALMCVIEGHAVFIQEKVGKELKVSEEVMQAYLGKAAGFISFKDPIMQMRNKIGMTKMEIRYLRGKDFIDYNYEIGKNEKVWQILSNPPRDTAIIMSPSEYYPHTKHDIITSFSLANIFNGLEIYFGTGTTVLDNFTMPKSELKLLTFLNTEMRKNVMSNIINIQVLTINKGREYIGGIMICQLKDKSYGKKLLYQFEDLDKQVVTILKNNKSNYENRIETTEHNEIQADYACQQRELNGKGRILNVNFNFLHKRLLIRIVSFDRGEGTISKENAIKIYSSIISRYNRI
jgi:hypothetical protein